MGLVSFCQCCFKHHIACKVCTWPLHRTCKASVVETADNWIFMYSSTTEVFYNLANVIIIKEVHDTWPLITCSVCPIALWILTWNVSSSVFHLTFPFITPWSFFLIHEVDTVTNVRSVCEDSMQLALTLSMTFRPAVVIGWYLKLLLGLTS